jgi:CRISPR-associated protein Cas1
VTWRSIVVSRAASLRYGGRRLIVVQSGQETSVPLEDIAVLLLDSAEISLTSHLLQACAECGISVITVGSDHHPNGVLLPFLPHSRPLKMLERQINTSQPQRKRAWQAVVRQKILNQARCLELCGQPDAARLKPLAANVRSGDPDNRESVAARLYFVALFGTGFSRSQARLINAALNYGYAVLRAAIARSLTAYGYVPALGLHHHNELNAYNLADDWLEPFRPLVDLCVHQHFAAAPERDLAPADKALLVSLLHHDVRVKAGCYSTLAAIDLTLQSLGRFYEQGRADLLMLPELLPLALHAHE